MQSKREFARDFRQQLRERIRVAIASTRGAADPEGEIAKSEPTLPLDVLSELSRRSKGNIANIGAVPPGPATLRARIGAVLIRLVGRVLWWYTSQIAAQAALTTEVVGESVRALDRLSKQVSAAQQATRETAARVEALETLITGQSAEADFRFDAFYARIEDTFRGTREDIKDRLRKYLPLLHQAGVGGNGAPALDLGSGRGEWLELLREAGLGGSGVDMNRIFVQGCVQHGLKVVEADALDHLHGLPDGSLGAVTAFHIVEHLPLAYLADVLDEIVRVLRPGGVAILETPNPANLMVGANTFYYDPTHHNPIPAPLLKFLVESRGMARVEVWPVHPAPEACRLPEDGSELVSRFNEYFYGPQDYAVIGYRK